MIICLLIKDTEQIASDRTQSALAWEAGYGLAGVFIVLCGARWYPCLGYRPGLHGAHSTGLYRQYRGTVRCHHDDCDDDMTPPYVRAKQPSLGAGLGAEALHTALKCSWTPLPLCAGQVLLSHTDHRPSIAR
jgi:hypothetical protein